MEVRGLAGDDHGLKGESLGQRLLHCSAYEGEAVLKLVAVGGRGQALFVGLLAG